MDKFTLFFLFIQLYPIFGLKRVAIVAGGKEANIDDFPWSVYIQIIFKTHIRECMGSIISDEWVLTSAYCVKDSDAHRVKIFIGNSNWTNAIRYTGQEIYVASNTVQYKDDVGLVKVYDKFAFSNRVNKINLWPNKNVSLALPLETASWGKIHPHKPTASRLCKIDILRSVPFPGCYRMLKAYYHGIEQSFLTGETVLCTLTFDVAFRDADQGAAIVARVDNVPYLIAIHSFAPSEDADRTVPAVHTKIYPKIGWIQSICGVAPKNFTELTTKAPSTTPSGTKKGVKFPPFSHREPFFL